jgi:uracil-DNA glycosylase family 4
VTSLIQQHKERWKNGCGSSICSCAYRKVFCRGTYPCDVLFVGEAPGVSEDLMGYPFVGPAGHLQDRVIVQSLGAVNEVRVLQGKPQLTHAMTNLVCCIPRNEAGGKAGEPEPDDIVACAPRLKEFVSLCKPRLIVCLGDLARDWLMPQQKHRLDLGHRCQMIHTVHPAAIIRAPIAARGMMRQRAIVTITTACEELA